MKPTFPEQRPTMLQLYLRAQLKNGKITLAEYRAATAPTQQQVERERRITN